MDSLRCRALALDDSPMDHEAIRGLSSLFGDAVTESLMAKGIDCRVEVTAADMANGKRHGQHRQSKCQGDPQ